MADSIKFNPVFFDNIMKSQKIDSMCEEVAGKVLSTAQSTAPVKTGDYKRGLKKQRRASTYRNTWRVVGTDPKTMLVEAKTGNIARALRAVKKSG